jgi:glycerol-3-phosphate dehydrogenase
LLPAEPGGFYTGDERLYAIYGARARRIDELADSDPDNMLKPVAPGAPATVAEILHCVRHEKARTLGDILLRRTGLAFEPDYDPGWPAAIAEIVKGPLQWDDPAVEKALAGYQAELERTLARV